MRKEYFAFASNEYCRVIHFTRHFSILSAQKHYGDLGRHYRGNPRSDLHLSIYCGREEFEREMGEYYEIDYKNKTLTPREDSK